MECVCPWSAIRDAMGESRASQVTESQFLLKITKGEGKHIFTYCSSSKNCIAIILLTEDDISNQYLYNLVFSLTQHLLDVPCRCSNFGKTCNKIVLDRLNWFPLLEQFDHDQLLCSRCFIHCCTLYFQLCLIHFISSQSHSKYQSKSTPRQAFFACHTHAHISRCDPIFWQVLLIKSRSSCEWEEKLVPGRLDIRVCHAL